MLGVIKWIEVTCHLFQQFPTSQTTLLELLQEKQRDQELGVMGRKA